MEGRMGLSPNVVISSGIKSEKNNGEKIHKVRVSRGVGIVNRNALQYSQVIKAHLTYIVH